MPDYSRLERTLFTRTRLRGLKCVIVGAGALGNEVARTLGLLGAAKILVIDPDVVEPSNLPRSTFFFCCEEAVGKNKALAIADAGARMFPSVQWSAIPKEIADVGFQDIEDATVLFSCGDSDLVRLEVAYISTRLGIPVVDGGLGTQDYCRGRVTCFPAKAASACYGCMLTARRRRHLLDTWQSSLHSCALPDDGQRAEMVSTPTMASVIGALQVELGLRSVFEAAEGSTQATRSVELRLDPSPQMLEFCVLQDQTCPFHGERLPERRALPYPDCTLGQLMRNASAERLELDWPVCTAASCMDCGHRWTPMMRLAALRKRPLCPTCQSRNILEIDVTHSVEAGSNLANLTPSQLGLPQNHLHALL